MSKFSNGTLSPTMERTPSTAEALELCRLSTNTGMNPASWSATAVWLPMYPAPPVTSTLGREELAMAQK